MACQAMHSWTFGGLVRAYLDLAIAYVLLCASTLAFFASKFLGIFGLCLPCPCNGPFGNANSNYYLQRLLVDCPAEKASSIQPSAKSNFPFDQIWANGHNYQLNLKLIRERNNNVDRFIEMEGEASCSSISDVREGSFDLKGKGIMNQSPRRGLGPRREGNEGNEAIEGSSVLADSGGDANLFHYDEAACTVMSLGKRASHGFELNEPLDKNETKEKNASSNDEELKSNARGELGFNGNENNTIRVLEQALEEEHAARAALYLELEKERSAAATAADEAMAMILRLQEEKASIEMEAQQYQRIIEEKSAYDAEEMNILKEILVRRVREKHFLEKEVGTYRQMIYLGNEQLEGDWDMVKTPGQQLASSLDLNEEIV